MHTPLVIYHEHPEWMVPLFSELDRRGTPYLSLKPTRAGLPDTSAIPDGSLMFNRMSPSADKRGHGRSVLPSRRFLRDLEHAGVAVINGSRAYGYDINKVRQIELLRRLDLRAPRTRRVRLVDQIPVAAGGMAYPLMFKPNVGGSGTGVVLFRSADELMHAVEYPRLDFGLDGVGLLQEYHPPRDGFINRVETLDHEFLYGLRVAVDPRDGFNLCPADACLLTNRPTGQPGGPGVMPFTPDQSTLDRVECIARHAYFDVGGVEYLESERDGERYFYDLNAMSNFVATPEDILGFDPWPRLVDFLEQRRWARAA